MVYIKYFKIFVYNDYNFDGNFIIKNTVFDKDKKGIINKDELMQVEADHYIKISDKDRDGVISYKEFLEIMGYEDQ